MFNTGKNLTELQNNLQNRIRSFLLDFNGLKAPVKGFSLELKGADTYTFPFPALDWDSISLTGHTEKYFRKVSREDNWQSRISFRRPQNESIVVSDYLRYYCLVLASVDDAPDPLEDYFNRSG